MSKQTVIEYSMMKETNIAGKLQAMVDDGYKIVTLTTYEKPLDYIHGTQQMLIVVFEQ